MIKALQKALRQNLGHDIMVFRKGPCALYLWDAEKKEHTRYDPFYKPSFPQRRSFETAKEHKKAVKNRCTFLNRRCQAKRVSF
jgi:hypothetical protein